MESVRATTFIEICVNCPYCGAYDDKFEELRDNIEEDHRAENIDVVIKCSECEKEYIVEGIDF